MLIIGIDDAGRGPVIGPMVLAGCLIEDNLETEFKEAGVKDSKMLTQKRRVQLAELIRDKATNHKVVQIHPDEIDGSSNGGVNLNKLEAQKMAEIINTLNKGDMPIKVFIDCPSTNPHEWTSYLKEYITKLGNLEIISEHKADEKYPVVSAASILAKTSREEEVAKIKKKIGKDFGSGYPADPVTCKFLQEHSKTHENDGIFRKTWQTWKDLCGKKEQKKLF